jgi:hypothetical protein
MIPMVLGFLVLGGLAACGLYFGIVIARVVADQFDELLPQRMVDYSGFVETGSLRD